jgi:NitT/TauT family transport system ATP-binding protein
MAQPLIQIENVTKVFTTEAGDVPTVAGVTLDVQQGDFVTLVGPSGCGKSTLLNMIAGVFHPTTGSVLYHGQPITALNQRVGYMTQNDHLLPWRTVRGNVAVPLEIRGLPRRKIAERVEALLELVGLKDFEKAYPTQISGGMRKRTALARLLAYDPETLLMDEPFAALDAQMRLQLQIEILDLCHRLGKTVLFVTHDLDEALLLGNRCVVFGPRPTVIREIVNVPLPRDRDLMTARYDEQHVRLSARLWQTLSGPADPPTNSRKLRGAA